jgi:5-hydroxyisourate hydrolase
MSAITTHVLDTSRGRPAAGVAVLLERADDDGWVRVGGGTTDADGRARELLEGAPHAGRYRITFDTGAYFRAVGVEAFFPEVSVQFMLSHPGEHHHVPLLLNPFGYSTYRGS